MTRRGALCHFNYEFINKKLGKRHLRMVEPLEILMRLPWLGCNSEKAIHTIHTLL